MEPYVYISGALAIGVLAVEVRNINYINLSILCYVEDMYMYIFLVLPFGVHAHGLYSPFSM